ncbi:MAG: phytanoyl-CoA dioxygenase family protein [Pyrinomonadaceae bacterium]
MHTRESDYIEGYCRATEANRDVSVRLTEAQIEFYNKNGFLLVADYFSPAELDILMDELPEVFAEDTPRRILEKSGAVRSVFGTHTTNEVFRRLSRLPRLVTPAMQLLDSEVYIHQFKINAKVALEGDQWEWHQDFLYWHKEDGMPTSRVLSAAIFLQEVNEFNGPMLVIPGSHREGMIDVRPQEKFLFSEGEAQVGNGSRWMPTLTADLKYKINKEILSRITASNNIFGAKGSAGFVLFFDGNLFHASANNLSPRDRISIFVSYNSVENSLGEVANPRPEFIASRDFRPVVPVANDALLELGLVAR